MKTVVLYIRTKYESFTCTNTNCSDKLRKSDIDQLFVVALRESCLEAINGKLVVKTTLYPVGLIMLKRHTVKPEIVTFCGVIKPKYGPICNLM